MRAPSYDSLDEALETLSPYEIALKNGNSNHAPMVAEARLMPGLAVIGRHLDGANAVAAVPGNAAHIDRLARVKALAFGGRCGQRIDYHLGNWGRRIVLL